MKRILIFSHALELGGAERSLIGLLSSLDYTQYAVDLFLMRHQGELMAQLPAEVNLLPELPAYASLAVPFREVLRRGQLAVAVGRYIGKRKAARYVRAHELGDNGVALEYSHKYTRRFMPAVGEGTYDLAISFLTPHYFAAEKVSAGKKIAFIHTDYRQVAVDTASEEAMWNAYDVIAAVSAGAAEGFISVFPALASKVTVIENVLPTALIRADSTAFDAAPELPADGAVRLLSIGRFCTAKNFDNVPDVCARLVKAGINVRWYLIGFGTDEALIRRRIAEAGMEERVIVLGKRENPYPYIAACDIYVQPSRYEGKAVTVREAQTLGKPVVITAYPTSSAQLEDGADGVIVPMDNAGCAEGIAGLIRDPALQQRLSECCLSRDYSNAQEITKLM